MVELVIGIFIIVLVIGALAVGFVRSNDSSFASQRLVSRFSVLQQQIESVRQTEKEYGFGAVALTSSPTAACSPTSGDPTNPDAFVCGSGCSETFSVQSNYNNTAETFPSTSTIADSPESLLVNGCAVGGNTIGGGQLAPIRYADLSSGTTYSSLSSVPSGDPYATVYTFVTQTNVAGCNSSLGSCTGDVRRVVVAVVLSASSIDIGNNYPAYASTVISNPAASNQPSTSSGLKIVGVVS